MADQITYREIAPHTALSPYIDAYWTVTGDNTGDVPDKILPDGCVDIILNFGPAFSTESGATRMATGQPYLVGTMTRYKEMIRPPETRLVGVRFKPGGFPFFYDHVLLKNTADRTVEFDPRLLPVIPEDTRRLPNLLDHFFYDRFSSSPQQILPLIAAIRQAKGKITVSELAKRNFVTIRQLERLFAGYLDISPKQFINFARYHNTLEAIRRRQSHKSLLDIACECGYYDHAHLSNEIRKYTGALPSRL